MLAFTRGIVVARTCWRIASERRMFVAAIAMDGFFSTARAMAASKPSVSIAGVGRLRGRR